jgi:hypothetical protein
MKQTSAAILVLVIGATVGINLGARQNPGYQIAARGFKPVVVPLLSEARAFLVETQNTSSSDLTVTTFGLCKMRVDAVEVPTGRNVGSGSLHKVKPGESWRELVRIVRIEPTGQRVPNPLPGLIVGNEALAVRIVTGKHTVAFMCGGEWSDDVSFYWIETP